MCERLLANGVIEDFHVEIVDGDVAVDQAGGSR